MRGCDAGRRRRQRRRGVRSAREALNPFTARSNSSARRPIGFAGASTPRPAARCPKATDKSRSLEGWRKFARSRSLGVVGRKSPPSSDEGCRRLTLRDGPTRTSPAPKYFSCGSSLPTANRTRRMSRAVGTEIGPMFGPAFDGASVRRRARRSSPGRAGAAATDRRGTAVSS